MGIFDKDKADEAPTAEPTPTGGVVTPDTEGTETEQGTEQAGSDQPDTTPTETDH